MASTNPQFHRTLCLLATTNTAPSTQDAATIRETVEDIDQKIADRKSHLLTLVQELEDLGRERNFFKPMLSPMRRMPLEVLGEIFAQLLGSSPSHGELAGLCLVSKGWRNAAHSVPRFWQTVTLNPYEQTISTEVLKAWLNRARGLERTLHIKSRGYCAPAVDDKSATTTQQCLGSAKCPLSMRRLTNILRYVPLDAVTIECSTPQCLAFLTYTLRYWPRTENPPPLSSWKFVKSVAIVWGWNKGDEWINLDGSAFTFLPDSLRTLRLRLPSIGSFDDTSALEFNFPASFLYPLTSFHLSCNWGANYIFKILRHCDSLEDLTLVLGEGALCWNANDGPREITERGLVLAKLKTVKLNSVESDEVDTLVHLELPALVDLSIRLGEEGWVPESNGFYLMTPMDVHSSTQFGTFLRGGQDKSSTLKSLRITNGILEGDALFNTLQHLSSLEQLTLDNTVLPEDAFTKLSSLNALPKLHELNLLRLHTNPTNFSGLQASLGNHAVQLKTSRCDSADCGTCSSR